MAFTPDTLSIWTQTRGGLGVKQWIYDTLDTVGAVDAADYFSDCVDKGMEVGDLIYARVWTTSLPTASSGKDANTLADAAWFSVTSVDGTAFTVAQETAIVVAEA